MPPIIYDMTLSYPHSLGLSTPWSGDGLGYFFFFEKININQFNQWRSLSGVMLGIDGVGAGLYSYPVCLMASEGASHQQVFRFPSG